MNIKLNAPDIAGNGATEQPELAPWYARVSPTRSLLMMTAGAVLGLAIAGFGLFTAKGTATGGVPAEDIALVNNRPILVSDFIAQLEAEAGSPLRETTRAQRQKVLNDMIREELFVQRGLELDFPASDPDTRAALVAAVEQQVAADVTAQQPSEATLRAYFEQHRAAYASDGIITLHELVLGGPADAAARAKAAEAVGLLRSGASIETVAAQTGLRESGRVNDGDEFYFAAKIHLGDRLFTLAAGLPAGAVSEPQVLPDGLHVLSIVANKKPILQPYDDVRPKVMFDYKKAEQTTLEAADERYLRAKSDIRIAEEFR